MWSWATLNLSIINLSVKKTYSANLKQVEHLVKKTEEVAKKEVLFEYVDSLVKEQKKEYPKPVLKGAGIPWFQAVVIIAPFMAGYHVGLDEGTEATFLRLGRKRLD